MIELEKFKNIPLESSVLQDLMGNYKFPRNKVSALEKRGDIIRLKKGLYVVSEKISHTPPDFVIASPKNVHRII